MAYYQDRGPDSVIMGPSHRTAPPDQSLARGQGRLSTLSIAQVKRTGQALGQGFQPLDALDHATGDE